MTIVDRLPSGAVVILATEETCELARIVDAADTATRVRMLERVQEVAADARERATSESIRRRKPA